jgi:NADH:ubiquinone oxidoreductase subunit 4 (subunit M)
MTTREIVVMVPIVILFFVIGLFPNLFFEKINPPVEATTSQTASATTILEMGE